ncbi:HNH endonuclease [Pantoea sp. B9002]|uniref:HNH endonuclease n=1 Tax=Pantoea sp. B9002 TaxID=2726979 RepID=UPI0015A3D1DD|nr:HNH endonuclease [Pantoea sp. B9002]NWA62995.1 HNH endonuclease [Pantoea sp. B9002]
MTLEERLLSKVAKNPNSGCWEFTGSLYKNGYGQIWNGARAEQAHRVAYRFYVAEIPADKEIDHLCKNRRCVNPKHLDIVTHQENIARSNTVMGENARKTHCMRGHPLEGENLIITKQKTRQCRICSNMRARNAKARRKEKKNAKAVCLV